MRRRRPRHSSTRDTGFWDRTPIERGWLLDGARSAEFVRPTEEELDATNPNSVAFGYKCSWLAIKDVEPERVVEHLRLDQAVKCGWKTGIALAYSNDPGSAEAWAFVTPALGEWVLVVCSALPTMGGGDEGPPDELTPRVEAVSASLDTEVCGFGTHRIVGYDAWCRAAAGRLTRAYGYLGEMGEPLTIVGEPTPAEIELGLDDCIGNPGATEIDDDTHWPDECDVMRMAGAWSIDPQTLEAPTGTPPGPGWLGRIRFHALPHQSV